MVLPLRCSICTAQEALKRKAPAIVMIVCGQQAMLEAIMETVRNQKVGR